MHGNVRLNFRPTRKEPIPKKELVEAEPMSMGQKRPELERYRMQVDRQTKASFKSKTAAEKAGAAIKRRTPKSRCPSTTPTKATRSSSRTDHPSVRYPRIWRLV